MSDRLRIAINTGGGDAPGLNAVIYAVTMAALRRDWEVYGIQIGYAGLFDTSKIIPLTAERVAGIVAHGGTILGTTNRGDPFRRPVPGCPGEYRDESGVVVENFRRLGFDVLIAVGGDGSLSIAHKLSLQGHPGRRGPEDDRQRSRGDARDLRLRHRRHHRDGGDRQAALHRRARTSGSWWSR